MKKRYNIWLQGGERIKGAIVPRLERAPNIDKAKAMRSHGYALDVKSGVHGLGAHVSEAYETCLALRNGDSDTWRIIRHIEGPVQGSQNRVSLRRQVAEQDCVDQITAILILRRFDKLKKIMKAEPVNARTAMTEFVRHYSDFQAPRPSGQSPSFPNLGKAANI